jgi:HEPN domain-containing protein
LSTPLEAGDIVLPGPGTPEDWLRYARSDLALSGAARTPDILYETLCFHAQQAVEKSLKAVLIHYGAPFSRTHNIRTLIEQLTPHCGIPESVSESAGLSDYAVALRYPGEHEPIDSSEYLEAVNTARTVLEWAQETVRGTQPLL